MRPTPVKVELIRTCRMERQYLAKRRQKQKSELMQKLEQKAPEKLKGTLDLAFYKSFAFIFDKGTKVIELTYSKRDLKNSYTCKQIRYNQFANNRALRDFTYDSSLRGIRTAVLSGMKGVVLGACGIGLPDIAIFAATILKSVYEMALQYGFDYDTPEERYFILKTIETSLLYGQELVESNAELNQFMDNPVVPAEYDEQQQIRKTAEALSMELLCMKFLQGMAVIGAVGGAYDVVCLKKILQYAQMKYHRRLLSQLQQQAEQSID